jgi:diaminopimelate epimerase
MQISFTKMQGLGNDFILIDTRRQPFTPTPELIQRLSDRRRGIGFDQALVLEASHEARADIYFRIFNADGSEVEQCGNGARCIARMLDPSLEGRTLLLQSRGGLVSARCLPDGEVTVDMGAPKFAPVDVGFGAEQQRDRYALSVAGETVDIGIVSMGNPHAVLQVDTVEIAPVNRLGPAICAHPRFPGQVNVGFMEIVSKSTLKLRVYERGAGETLACGTGACAAAVTARRWGQTDEAVEVFLPGGRLRVSWKGPGEPVWMSGPAEFCFEGRIEL